MSYDLDLYLQARLADHEREMSRHLRQADAQRSAGVTARAADGPRACSRFAALSRLLPWTAKPASPSPTHTPAAR